MKTLFASFPQRSVLTLLLVGSLILFAALFTHLSGERSRAAAQQLCGSTFGGSWRSTQSPAAVLRITPIGSFARGTFRDPAKRYRDMEGTISGVEWNGTWREVQVIEGPPANKGRFSAILQPNERRMTVIFYSGNSQFDRVHWTCGSRSAPPPTPTPYTPTVTATPTPTPFPLATPTPVPSPNATWIRDDHDIDNFQTFDSLDEVEQQKVLIRRGPRSQKVYTANDLSMRVLARSGWPVALDYGLSNADFATLTIEIPGLKPESFRLEQGERKQVRERLPNWRGNETRVAKIQIETSSPDGDFRIYGFGMGENATLAVQRGAAGISHLLLATNNANVDAASNLPALQIGTSVGISVTLPSSLRLGQSPRQRIQFSYLSNSDFSDGRWEWWRVSGTRWEKVWQKGTGGITRNQSKSQTWDGIITSARLDSIGFHSLSISVWQKADQPEWVAARTDPQLEVIR